MAPPPDEPNLKAKMYPSGPKFSKVMSKRVKYGLAIGIVIVICIVIAVALYMTFSDNNEKQQQPPAPKPPRLPQHNPQQPDDDEMSCKRDSDCSSAAVCGPDHQKMGCCAKCLNSACKAGMVTANGCVVPSTSPDTSYGSSHASGVSGVNILSGLMSAISDGTTDNKSNTGYSISDMGAELDLPGNQDTMGSIASCRSHNDAFMKTCLGKDPMCCAVCVSGLSFQGVRGPDGTCQTTVQQTGYTGMGQEPPNTYMVSSSGPKYGVAMGGCSVEPVGSSLSLHTGLYQQPHR